MNRYTQIQPTLPFHINSINSVSNNQQTICNKNMCVLPNGPILPTRPIFPSALPSDFTPSTTSIDTNYLTVKKVGCICNLSANSLKVDNTIGETQIVFKNLPEDEGDGKSYLLIDKNGRLYKAKSTILKTIKKSYYNIEEPFENMSDDQND